MNPGFFNCELKSYFVVPYLTPMIIRFLFLLVLFFPATLMFGQDLSFSTRLGKEFKASRKSSLSDIVAHDATGIYVTKQRFRSSLAGTNSYTLEQYDNVFNLIQSSDLEIEEEGHECRVEYFLHLQNRLYVFYSYANNKEKKNSLFVSEINKKTLRPDGKKKKIGEIDYSGNSRRNDGNFDIRVSRDSSKILVEYALPFDTDEPEQFGFNVLDEELNSLWEKSVTLPYKDQLYDVESIRVDNQGNVYLLGIVYKDKHKDKRKGKPNYSYEVIACRDKGNSLTQYPVSLEDKFITDMQIQILDNNNLICAGFYSKEGTFSIRGTYFLTIDAETKAIKTKSIKEFDLDFITQNMSEREANRAVRKEKKGEEAELYEYNLDNLLVGKDGSAILIGEQYYVTTYTTTSRMNGVTTTHTTTYYNYNDIIAVKVNAAGQIEWAEKVAKTQHTSDDGGFFSSYTLAIVNGKICFIFNDSPKNLDKAAANSGKTYNFRANNLVVVVASLDRNGKETRQPIFSSVDLEVIARPKVCEQISNKEVILFGQRRKTQQFAKITFE